LQNRYTKARPTSNTFPTIQHIPRQDGLYNPTVRCGPHEAFGQGQAGATTIHCEREPEGKDTTKLVYAHKISSPRANCETFADTGNFVAVHTLTDVCWRKCVTGTIRSGKLDKTEDACAQNCVDRFLDANFLVIKHLESMRNTQ
jgi:hypothetical protein